MKVAIITDTHYGARKGSKHIHDYFEKFYKNVFFPSLEEHNIDTVIHMGDIFDSRKAIDLQSLEWSKKVVFEPMKKYRLHAIIGNHDCYYKDTNYVNSPELLLNDYSNITTYSEPAEINLDGLDILLLPWINSENYESTKNLIVEETRGLHKFVMPRLKPFKAISKLTTNAEPLKYDSSGMLFYEDSTGFRFRSLENMLAISGVARPVVAKFQQKPRNVKGGTGVTDIISEMQTVDGYSIVNQFDTLKNLSNGVYASKVITHDIFNKTFSEIDFDYNLYFPKIFHTEHDGSCGKVDNKGQLPLFNYKDGKMISDKPEGSLNFVSTTEKLQNDYEGPEGERTLPRNDAQKFSFKSQSISLDCKGFTGLSVGDLVSFEVPSYEPPGMDNPLDIDPYMSGRYLVYKIHHRISSNADVHTMNLECVKDAVRVAYPEENIDTFSSRENNDSLTYLQYELDEALVDGANTEGHNEIMA